MKSVTGPPLRIYWITETFFPPIVGGQELLAHALTQGMAERGVTAGVITRQTHPPSPVREIIGHVEVRRISPAGFLKGKGWKALFPLIHYLCNLAWVLIGERHSYDVLIVSSVKLMPLVVVPICRIFGKICILRAESIFELSEAISAESMNSMGSFLGTPALYLLRGVRNACLRHAGSVVAISSEIHRKLQSIGVPANRIADISNAVDLTRFHPIPNAARSALKNQLGFPPERCHAIYVGRLSRAKGLPLLIQAWPAIRAAHPELCLLVVGAGNVSFDNCESYLRDFVHGNQLDNDIFFLGEQTNVQQYLQAADLFVFPSEYEGFSLVLVEAMACGLPVVVTSVGGAPDIIEHGHSGFLFPPKDSASLRRAIDAAIECRPEWNAIGAHACRAAARFDLPVIVRGYIDLANRLTTGTRG